jgi:hypothetical protein
MIFKSKWLYNLSVVFMVAFFAVLIYLMYNAFFVVKNQFIHVAGATYVNQVKNDEFVKNLALQLKGNCETSLCEVQQMLDFVTNIPYVVNPSVSRSPKNTVKQNFGDCDDKSNLLISLLHAHGFESYFVLVPEHIFVIVSLDDAPLNNKKGLYVNGKKYYILETTAKNSKVGFPLKQPLSNIHGIIEPFKNKALKIESIAYKE